MNGFRRIEPLSLIAVCLLLCGPCTSLAGVDTASEPEIGRTDRTLSPYFYVEGAADGAETMPLESTEVEVEIAGVIADVTVRQRYRNDGDVPIHARYVFPASTRAAVHGMRMTVGGHVVEAVIQERAEARRTFEKAKKEGKSASLLEQQRPNVFTMRLSNVMPGDRIDVELRYSELIVPTDGVYEFVYPTVVGPRYAAPAEGDEHDRWIASCYLPESTEQDLGASLTPPEFRLGAHLSTGIPLQEVSSPTHLVLVDWDGLDDARVTLDASESAGADRDFILRYRLAGSQIAEGLLLQRGERENFFLLMLEPPARVADADVPPREYVFVVDVSGSMSGYPLDTAKALLRDLVGSLRPTDRFNVILFAGTNRRLAEQSVPASPANVAAALDAIDRQRGGGGTELLAAVRAAMTLPHAAGTARSIVVVTDGYIGSEQSVFGYVRENLGEASVFAFGVGSAVNRLLIEGLARAGLGEPFVVTDPAESEAVVERFAEYLRFPLLTDVRFEYDGFETYDVEPAALPDLLAERPLVVHGKWRGEPAGRIRLSGTTGHGAYERTIDVGDIAVASGSDALAHLWARTRLSSISDFRGAAADGDALRAEIVRLGLDYDLLTKYTSFVAVHRQVRNPGGDGRETDQPLPLPRGVSELAVGVGPEPELWILLALVACGLGTTGWLHGRARRTG